MGRPRSPDYETQRDTILRRSVDAFAEHGYPSTSMAQIALACGTSKAGLYHYYRSKESILFDLLDRYTARLERVVVAVGDHKPPARDHLRGLVRVLMAEYRDSRAYHLALLNDVKFLDEPSRELIRARERRIVEVFSDVIERAWPGRIGAAARTPTTMALLGMVNFTFAWLRPEGPMSHEQYAELVIGLWEHGMQGEPPVRHDPL
jgi:AcrR family transcriptional regulator